MHQVVVIISANSEWRAVKELFPQTTLQTTPYGEWFETALPGLDGGQPVVFIHGGWGKISAAASAHRPTNSSPTR